MHHVGYLQRLYRDARSTEHKILMSSLVSLALFSVLSVASGWQQVICSVALEGDL